MREREREREGEGEGEGEREAATDIVGEHRDTGPMGHVRTPSEIIVIV